MQKIIGVLAVVVLTPISVVVADAIRAEKPQNQTKPAKLDPRLEEILTKWERASSNITHAHVNFRRHTYERTFRIERRSTGIFYFEAPNKGRYETQAVTISPEAVSAKKDRHTGKPYDLRSDYAEIWIWDGRQVAHSGDNDKLWDALPIVEQDGKHGVVFWNQLNERLSKPQNVLPLVVDVKAADLKERFDLKLVKDTEEQIWISALPRTEQDKNSFSKKDVILDPKSYLTKATRVIDMAGVSQTVHVFEKWKINEPLADFEKREAILKPNDDTGKESVPNSDKKREPISALKPR